jgi:uncharacterized membrane protein
MTWYGHHDNFRFIRRVDGRLFALNFASLLLVAFLPFPTAVLGRFATESAAAVLYAITLVLMNLANAATWWYVTYKGRLVEHDLDDRMIRGRLYRLAVAVVIFSVSIPLALWRPIVAEIAWLPLFGLGLILRPAQRAAARSDPKPRS